LDQWNPEETPMKTNDKASAIPAEMTATVARSIEQARGAMANYFKFIDTTMSASPLAVMDQTKTLRTYAERNVAAAFDLAEELIQAKDFQDVMRIQSEFVAKQMQVLSEQAKDLGTTASKAAADAVKAPLKPQE
jgi:hypothetical protein